MKKLLFLCLLMAAMSLFPSANLFAQLADTLRTDTLWYDNFNDGDFTSNYQWNLVDWYGTTTGDASSGQFVIKTSVSGTGVIAYSFGNGWTDGENYLLSCKAKASGTTGWENFQVFAKVDVPGTKSYQIYFDCSYGGNLWLLEGYSASWLAWGASPAVQVDSFFNAKVAVSGDIITAKAWKPGTSEPDWQLFFTRATVPGGYKNVWRGVQIGGYYIDSVTVDDLVVYGSPYCDYPAGDVDGSNTNPTLGDVIWLAKYVLGFPGFPLTECPSGR